MTSAYGDLFSASLHLFGVFFENPPPSADVEPDWDELERLGARVYSRAGLVRPGDMRVLAAIRDDCRRCLAILVTLPSAPIVERAIHVASWCERAASPWVRPSLAPG